MNEECEVCGKDAKWDCEHITGRSTKRCNKHSGITKTTTGNERKLVKHWKDGEYIRDETLVR